MIEQATTWYLGRSKRERVLLGVAGTLTLFAVLAYGVVLPSYSAIKGAERQLDIATERHGRIEARTALAKANPTVAGNIQATESGALLSAIVSESAAAQGFEIADGVAAGTDEFAFRLASAKAGALLVWITSLEAQGIMLAEIKMRKGDGGYISADIRLRKKT
jgi:general secretion pathway protein M